MMQSDVTLLRCDTLEVGIVRYRIEYLSAAPTEASVCGVATSDSSLASAVLQARVGANIARIQHRANGFQIRDQFQRGLIVIWERFWGFDEVAAGASWRRGI